MSISIFILRWRPNLLIGVVLFVCILPNFVKSQSHKTTLDFNIGLKCSANLSGSPSNHFSLGISIGTAIHKDDIPASLMIQSAINIYANGLGTNILNEYIYRDKNGETVEKRRKVEVDFINSLIGNIEFGDEFQSHNRHLYPIKHFNQMTAYSNYALKYYSLSYGTNFIINSHHRNQQVGFVGANTPWLSFGFYNDGTLGNLVGDNYDRFWTGGGHLRLHAFNPNNTTATLNEFSIEYNFDRFTYDVQDGYRLANILMIPNADDNNFYNLLFNNSLTTLKVNWNEYSAGISFIGRTNFDIQDKIHDFFGYPRHLTYANKETMLTLGFTPLIK